MTEAEEKAVEYLKANSLVRLNENNEVVAYGNAHKYYIINLIEKLQKENEEYKLLNANIEKANKIIEGKEEYIPKAKIREKINELEYFYKKEVKPIMYQWTDFTAEEHYKEMIQNLKELLEEK